MPWLLLFSTLITFIGASATSMEQAYKEGETWGRSPPPEFPPQDLDDLVGGSIAAPSETTYLSHPETLAPRAAHLCQKGAGRMIVDIKKIRGQIIIAPKTDPLILAGDRIVNHPLTAIGTRAESHPHSPQPTPHVCYESGEPQRYTCTIRRHIALKEIPLQKKQIGVQRYRDCYSGPLLMNILTGQRLDGNAHYRGSAHAASISYQGEGFPPDLIPHVRSSRVISGPFRITPDHNVHCDNPHHCHRSATHGAVEITYARPPTEADLIEKQEDNCVALEKQCDEGHCHYGDEILLEGASARLIQNGSYGLSVTRPWWYKKRTYYCSAPSSNNCDVWRKKGCTQIHSQCHKKQGTRCIEWAQTFECPPSHHTQGGATTTNQDLPFGLDGSAANSAWKANEDMTQVLSKLSFLKHIKEDKAFAKEGKVFQGHRLACSKHCLNFSDCCALSSGWGESLKLTRCSAAEKELSHKRQRGTCHTIGTYCAERAPLTKICLRKKTVFCCFDSKLARLIHEQSRVQLGIGWGTPESPQCRALTLKEFKCVNFERIDFSEIYKDVLDKLKLPDTSQIVHNFETNWKARLPSGMP